MVRVESTDTDTNIGPVLELFRNPSDSTATDGDKIGELRFSGIDDGGGDELYAFFRGIAVDTHSTVSDGAIDMYSRLSGASTRNLRMGNFAVGSVSGLHVNPDGSSSIDLRADTDNLGPFLLVDSSQDNCGIGGQPDSGVERLHVKGTDASKDLVMFESDDTDGNDDGPDLVLYRSKESPGDGTQLGSIKFRGRNNATADIGYAHIEAEVESGFGTSANGLLRFGVVADGTSPTDILYVSGNGTTPNVGIGISNPNTNTLLHISDDGSKANTVRNESTDNDTSVGPVLDLRRNNADGTATDGDNLGVIQFAGLDDGGGSEVYARIRASAADTHSTLAEGALEFLAATNIMV